MFFKKYQRKENKIKFSVIVTSSKKTHEIIFFAWPIKRRDKRLLEDEFYIKWSDKKEIPRGLHHEIEITYISANINNNKIHAHQSQKNKRWFICYTNPVKTLETALLLIKMWSAGTIYTIEHNEPFDKFLTPEEMRSFDFIGALNVLKKEYGITVKITQIK